MDALFDRLKRNAIGCHVGPVYAGAFGYADDVALVAPSLYSLRCVIATCEEFANEYRIDFNPAKSKLICFNANIDHLDLGFRIIYIDIRLWIPAMVSSQNLSN